MKNEETSPTKKNRSGKESTQNSQPAHGGLEQPKKVDPKFAKYNKSRPTYSLRLPANLKSEVAHMMESWNLTKQGFMMEVFKAGFPIVQAKFQEWEAQQSVK